MIRSRENGLVQILKGLLWNRVYEKSFLVHAHQGSKPLSKRVTRAHSPASLALDRYTEKLKNIEKHSKLFPLALGSVRNYYVGNFIPDHLHLSLHVLPTPPSLSRNNVYTPVTQWTQNNRWHILLFPTNDEKFNNKYHDYSWHSLILLSSFRYPCR